MPAWRQSADQCVFSAVGRVWRPHPSPLRPVNGAQAGQRRARHGNSSAKFRSDTSASRSARIRFVGETRVDPPRRGKDYVHFRFNNAHAHARDAVESTDVTMALSHERVRRTVMAWDTLSELGLEGRAREQRYDDFGDLLRRASVQLAGQRPQAWSPGLAGKPIEAEEKAMEMVKTLKETHRKLGRDSLDKQLQYQFYAYAAEAKVTTAEIRNQSNLADLRYPLEWYNLARNMKRKFHLHIGPTNSGKTYHALKALESAKHGMYGGPLRLLAHEVYTRMNNKGKKCMLVTGDERRLPTDGSDVKDVEIMSCTVEMVNCNVKLDVAVIDEIQMIADEFRGWAWTQAVLGVQARELHLCGEERAVPIITALVAMMGDELVIHRYERLTPLKMDVAPFNGSFKALQKGDAVVSFSILNIHSLRRAIENRTGKRVAIVYGSLPPETRAQQAALFNDPNNDYDFLVASDAIGMGLNLAIKRIVFESSQKNHGRGIRKTLEVSEIKQIAGRAGRYRTAHEDAMEAQSLLDAAKPAVEPTVEFFDTKLRAPAGPRIDPIHPDGSQESQPSEVDGTSAGDRSVSSPSAQWKPQPQAGGLVTTLYPEDWPIIAQGMMREAKPITTAGLIPPPYIVERFASYFPPGTPFSYVLLRLCEVAKQHKLFHLCNLRDGLMIADAIQHVEGLSTMDRLAFISSPANMKDPIERAFIAELAYCVANGEGGELLVLSQDNLNLELLKEPTDASRTYLQDIERLHKQLTLYLWLSYRFSGIFSSRNLAFYVKSLVEKRFSEALAMFSFSARARRREMRLRAKSLREQQLMAANEEAKENDKPADEDLKGRTTDGDLEETEDEYKDDDDDLGTSLDIDDDVEGATDKRRGLNISIDDDDLGFEIADGDAPRIVNLGLDQEHDDDSGEDESKIDDDLFPLPVTTGDSSHSRGQQSTAARGSL